MSIRKPWGLGCYEKRAGRWFEVLHQILVFFFFNPLHCLRPLLVTVSLMNLFSLTAHNPQEEPFLRLHPFMVFYPAAVSQTGVESATESEKTKNRKKASPCCASHWDQADELYIERLRGELSLGGEPQTPAQPSAPSISCVSCSQTAYSLLDKIISFA